MLLVFLGFDGGIGLAGGLRDFGDSWPIKSSTTRRLLMDKEMSSSAQHGLFVSIGQGRLFEMPDLNQRFLALEGSYSSGTFALRFAGQWEQTGSEIFVEDRLAGLFLMGKNPSWGVVTRWFRQTLGGRREESNLEFGALWEMGFHLGKTSGRILLEWPLKRAEKSPGLGRRRTISNITIATSDLAAAFVIDRNDDGTPNIGFHLLLAVGSGVGLELRADSATGSLGPGLSLVRGSLMLRTSHVIHPHLGVTHRLLLVVGKIGGGS